MISVRAPISLPKLPHSHHQLSVSTLHVHLDTEQCLEVAVLRGRTGEVQAEAAALIAERHVLNGSVHLIAVG